ncbi:glycogenin glucosyltransferase [Coemansia erecta]|uniref:glycogenin glucosyltransferase n=1 Tax=Coemansia erecta TaxID=147472 RepID=A0A9W7XW13_9FUNG|nr:glycogenin glucosyltransferase [Coemansia erecta]
MDEDAGTTVARPATERFAYVTLVTSDGYVDGALVLLHSLRRTLTPFSVVCLATPHTLSAFSLQRLHEHFDGVIETDVRLSSDDQGLELLGRPDLRSTMTKIQLWDPALFGAWDALCYLDADTLVRQSIDDLFSRYHTWREETPRWREGGLVAASPDTGWPDCFNSGVLLLAPGYECFQSLVRRASSLAASFDGADQGLLNEHFSDWSTAQPYRRLPFVYNSTANVYYTYMPALQRFGHEVRVVHFIGISKPWNWERTPGGQLISDSATPERWRQLVNLWWNIHDEHVSGWVYWRGPFSKSAAFGAGYCHITEPVAPEPVSAAHHESHSADSGTHGSKDFVQEVPDWNKDWSWAADRVHPLDYAYLRQHTYTPQPQHQPRHQSPPPSNEYHHHHYGDNSARDHGSEHSGHYEHRHDSHGHDHGSNHGVYDSGHGSHDHHYHHHGDSGHGSHHQPHSAPPNTYGGSSEHGHMQGHGDTSSGNYHHSHHDHHDGHHHDDHRHHGDHHQHGGHHDRHYDQRYGHHEQQQQQDSHQQQKVDPPAWMQSQRPWEDVAREGWLHHDEYKPHSYDQAYIERRVADRPQHHEQSDNGGYHDHHQGYDHHDDYYHEEQHQHHHEHGHHYHHHQEHFPQHGGGGDHQPWGYNARHDEDGRDQHYTPMPLPSNQPLYEASQIVLQPHNHGNEHRHQDSGDSHHYHQDDHYQAHTPSARSSRSNTGSSPIHYPQPKSPLVVNPVALWESSEEQARRRAWAQQVRAPLGEQQYTQNGEPSPFTGALVPDQRVPPSSMDSIDSSQLPADTPWKISHVRQRPSADDARSVNAPPPPHAGMQFKEGVASDGNARDAAGQLLQRWNEAVISRNLRPHFGSIDSDQISHSIPRLERGTDAIRLETTVSCEAEDSKGERTVYRFTLSSTLDVGGAQSGMPPPAAAPLHPLQKQPQQQQQQMDMAVQPGSIAAEAGRGIPMDEENSMVPREYTDITDLRQPANYQEPAMSRRSSFVQLPPTAARSAQTSLRGGPEYQDQFAVADARYWKLQRQLIDLEMSQNRQEDRQRLAAGGTTGAGYGSGAGGWGVHEPETIDLASPPTPTRKQPPPPQMSYGIEPPGGRRLVRRPSAFSIADPVVMQEQQPTQSSIVAAAAPPIAASDTRNRSASSPRLASMTASEDTRRHRALASASTSSNGNAGAFVQPQAQPESSAATADVPTSPGMPRRSRSYSALRRIATEKNAQAAVLPKKPKSVKTHEATGPTFAADDTIIPRDSVNGSGAGDAGNDADGDSSVDSENDKDFLSATGRAPTPYPRSLLRRNGSTIDNAAGDDSATSDTPVNDGNQAMLDSESSSIGKRRNIPESLQIDASARGFEPTQFDMSPASAGTPLTPGRQKIRPTINWGDDDGDEVPADNDMSLNAQWLRIIKGTPPSRAPIFAAKADLPSQPPPASEQSAAEPVGETEEMPIGDGAETPIEINIDELTIATKESLDNSSDSDRAEPDLQPTLADTQVVDPDISADSTTNVATTAAEHSVAAESPAATAVATESPIQPPQIPQQQQQQQQQKKPSSGTRAPPRKLHSTKSFLNLTSKTYDTVSDSEMDPGELEIQEKFWARAMKLPKSGASTPYTPGRRKSIVEMSSAISPRDLEAWMHWQGDQTSAISRPAELERADDSESAEPTAEPRPEMSDLITPPTSKDRASSNALAIVLGQDDSDDLAESSESDDDDDELEIQFTHPSKPAIVVDPQSPELADIADNGSAIDLAHGLEVARLKLHRDRITALAAGSCSCESLLLSGSDDSTVALWDTRDNKSTGVIGGFDLGEDDGGITGIGFASDFSLVVSYGAHVSVLDRRKISRYSQRSAVALADFDHGCDVEALSTRGDFVALVDEEGMVGVFDVTDSSISVDKFAGAHDALASCVTIHPEQPEIATGGFDQKVRFWDMAEETQINEVDANVVSNRTSSQKQLVNPPFVYALDYWNIDADASTRMLASGHADGGIMCIDGDSARFWPECHGYSISAL